jgi:hypothetical protein
MESKRVAITFDMFLSKTIETRVNQQAVTVVFGPHDMVKYHCNK